MVDTVTITGAGRTVTLDNDQFARAAMLIGGDALPAGPRELVTGGDPDARYPVPSVQRFVDDRGSPVEFIDAPELAAIAVALMDARAPLFNPVRGFKIGYLWKLKGGEESGKAKFGQCARTSGLVRYFGTVDFVIWLAADHCRNGALTRWQVEALVCHELLHATINEKGAPAIAPHEFAGFLRELAWYGSWQRDLQRMVRQAQQLPLFDGDADGDDE